MEIDVTKLEKSIIYMDRIANGRNPVNNLPAEDDAVLNDPNVIRCMFFIKEVLEEVKRNGCSVGKRAKRDRLDFPLEALKEYKYIQPLALSNFANQLNEMVDTKLYKKISYQTLKNWLVNNGYLKEEFNQSMGKNITIPTPKGIEIGIKEQRGGQPGREYAYSIYGREVQEIMIKNMKEILHGEPLENTENN